MWFCFDKKEIKRIKIKRDLKNGQLKVTELFTNRRGIWQQYFNADFLCYVSDSVNNVFASSL
jgi:hypothetical protein